MKKNEMYDLEELVMSVRNAKSKAYMLEAMSAYHAGALNSAVCSIWIAVVFDIISKIREISSQGDKKAKIFIQNLDNAVSNKSIPALVKIEEDILKTAHEDYEFISHHEFVDLKRLKEDRNFCAHPAFVSDDSLFQPAKELVKVHIVHSIIHLLAHQPVQGKSAIESVQRLILSESFPDDPTEIETIICKKYLDRSKDSFVKNLTIVLWKQLLKSDNIEYDTKSNAIMCILGLIASRHQSIFKSLLKEKLNDIIDGLDGEKLLNTYLLVNTDSNYRKYINEPNQIRLKKILSIIPSLPSPASIVIKCKLFKKDLPYINEHLLMEIFNNLKYKDQEEIICFTRNSIFNDVAIKFFCAAGSFRGAEHMGEKLIIPRAHSFTKEQILLTMNAFNDNTQIKHASGSRAIIEEFFDITFPLIEELKQDWIDLYVKLTNGKFDDDFWNYVGLKNKLIYHGLINAPDSERPDIISDWGNLINYVKERKVWISQDLTRCTPAYGDENKLILHFDNEADSIVLNQPENTQLLESYINTFSKWTYEVVIK